MPIGRGQQRRGVALFPAVAILAALALAAERLCLGAFLPAPGPLRRNVLIQGLSAAGFGALAQAPAALAESSETTAPAWQGFFDDPMHPGCKREISVIFDDLVQIDGRDGDPGPGCDFKSRQVTWRLKAKLASKDGPLLVDFSPKGGPSDVKGEWKDGGIVFPDGNKWSPKTIVRQDYTRQGKMSAQEKQLMKMIK